MQINANTTGFCCFVNPAFNWRVAGDSSADAHWRAALLMRRVQPAVQASQHSPQSQVRRGQETPGSCRLRTREVTQHSPPPSTVLRIPIRRTHMFLGLWDPDPLVRDTDPDPDASIIKQK
jgi:hypothetical protein